MVKLSGSQFHHLQGGVSNLNIQDYNEDSLQTRQVVISKNGKYQRSTILKSTMLES